MAGMRSIASVLVVSLAALSLGGCALIPVPPTTTDAAPGAASSAASSTPDAAGAAILAEPGHPADLVGMWRVTDAVGGEGDSWLRVDEGSATLWRTCGVIAGSWRATASLFAMDMHMSFGEGCRAPGDMSVPWLEQAVGFDASVDGVLLLDTDGMAVATLIADTSGALPPADPVTGVVNTVPVLTPEARESLEPVRVIPAGFAPEPATNLVGRWVVTEEATFVQEQPYVDITADGRFIGSDGCNGGGGRWALGEDGSFIATNGPMTLAGCGGSPLPSWLSQASSIGGGGGEADGDELRLFGPDGLLIATLVAD